MNKLDLLFIVLLFVHCLSNMCSMPIKKSAKKALRSSKRKKVFNLRYKRNIENSTKKFKKLVSGGNLKEAQEFFKNVQKALDKAVKHSYIKKNTAARKKSRLSRLLKKI